MNMNAGWIRSQKAIHSQGMCSNWLARLRKAGLRRASQGTEFAVVAGARQVTGTVANTQGDWVFKTFPVGEIELAAGEQALQVKANVRGGVPAMNLERLTLTPAR
jgi:hypothetical protein